MKRAWILTLVLAACGAPAPIPATTVISPSAPAPQEDGVRIVAFGDSLTAGLGVEPEEAYPAQLERKLAAEGVRATVVNAGVSGDTSAQALDRLDWTLKDPPDVAIVVLGANDGLRGLPLAQLEENLVTIVTRFQDAGAGVLLGGMKMPPNYGEAYARDFAAVYPRVARDTGAELLPFFLEGVAAETALNQRDGIHPTGEGYARIVEDVVWPVLAPIVPR